MDTNQIRRALGILAIMSMLIHIVVVFMGAAVDPYPNFNDETPDYTICCAGLLLIAVFSLSGVNALEMISQPIGRWVSLVLIAMFILFGVAYFISNKFTLPMNINTFLFVIYGCVAPIVAYFTSEET